LLEPLMHSPRSKGLTLIELLVVVVVSGVLLSMAVPSFVSSIARMRLEGIVNELSVDLQYARSASIRRRAAVLLTTSADGRSYRITLGNEVLKAVNLPNGLALSGDVAIDFDPLRGTAVAATLDATSNTIAAALRVTTNSMGRIQTCSPSGGFSGYSAC
jgi:prepilin-type N-terminal cleavage/methylation domain-containing protein